MNNSFLSRDNRIEKLILRIVLLTGVALVLYQFFLNRSLWRDEAKLALNIINKSSAELLIPLDYLQVAPVLFLQIEKLFSLLLPNTELGLRLFPLLCYLLSLFLFNRIVHILFKDYSTRLFSLSLFVFNATLVYYSSEVKQYMVDVMVLTVLYYLVLRTYRNQRNKWIALGAAGVLGVFLSNVTPLILLSIGLYLLYDNVKNKRSNWPGIISVSLIWGSTLVVYYLLFVHNHPLRERMIIFWGHNQGFMPQEILSRVFLEFLLNKFSLLIKMNGSTAMLPTFHRSGDEIIFIDVFLLAFISYGFVRLCVKRRIDILILTLAPIALQLLLSGFKLYPFDTRLLIYTCPLIVVVSSFGFDSFQKAISKRVEIKSSLASVIPILLGSSLFVHKGFPIENIELKKSIVFLQENVKEKDRVFLSQPVRPAFEYYQQISDLALDSERLIYGKQVWSEPDQFIKEIVPEEGRVWFVFDSDFQHLFSYLQEQGYKPMRKFSAHGSVVYLLDL